jgi:integrase
MEISDLILSGEKLLTLLKSSRYSDDYRWKIGGCVKFLKSNRNNTWESYEDIAEAFSSNPAHKRNDGKKSYFSFVLYYHLNQALPGYHSIRNVTNRKCALNLLNEYYKRLALIGIDYFRKRRSKVTTDVQLSARFSGFLLFLQNNGCRTLYDVTEELVRSYFTRNGTNLLSSSAGWEIGVFLEELTRQDISGAEQVRSFVPHIPKRRKPIQYLTSEEVRSIEKIIRDENYEICLRDRAIVLTLIYTGLRRSDIANIKLSSLDWENDVLNIVQQKTEEPLSIPLRASYANYIWDYIHQERDRNESEYLFLSKHTDQKLTPAGISNILNNIYDLAEVRMNKGDRRGCHLFRHHYVRINTEAGIESVVISSVIGHIDPSSINEYLNTDLKHLSEMGLSLEDYPVTSEVFGYG